MGHCIDYKADNSPFRSNNKEGTITATASANCLKINFAVTLKPLLANCFVSPLDINFDCFIQDGHERLLHNFTSSTARGHKFIILDYSAHVLPILALLRFPS